MTDKQLVQQHFNKWEKGTGNFFDLLDDNAKWTVSGRSPVSGTYNGKVDFIEGAVKPIISKFKSPLKPELISLTDDDTFIWLHFKASANTIYDDVYENTYVWKMQLKNGKITQGIAFLDTYELTNLMTKQR